MNKQDIDKLYDECLDGFLDVLYEVDSKQNPLMSMEKQVELLKKAKDGFPESIIVSRERMQLLNYLVNQGCVEISRGRVYITAKGLQVIDNFEREQNEVQRRRELEKEFYKKVIDEDKFFKNQAPKVEVHDLDESVSGGVWAAVVLLLTLIFCIAISFCG